MNTKTLATSLITTLLALGVTQAHADDAKAEKCYGIVKANKNDCQTRSNACAGHATADRQADAWVYVPKGTCDKLAGGSLASK
ncbi:MAG: DUF2282 domain-containing protein [Gammaproteobacteria bacterium]|nr:DUF2282 domain-containing protein [Gammaproteobacteria bacterium]MBI5618577.1 DUF2282 domain-containing protein [Gammaproteobacteria bacterium]